MTLSLIVVGESYTGGASNVSTWRSNRDGPVTAVGLTVVKLVETALESMHYLDGIASIRGYYRTLGPDAARHFAPENGRWPEVESPATRLGPMLGFFGTTASMIAIINNVVAGAGIALLTRLLSPSAPRWMDAAAGSVGAFVLTFVFYAYQRWRFREFNVRSRERIGK